MPTQAIEHAAVGWPLTRLGVSFYPVYLAPDGLPEIVTGEGSGLVVDELEQPSVGKLRVSNPGHRPVLIVEGEHFLGMKQNRTVNATVLVPSLGDMTIPVSCLERGRWGRRRAVRRDEAFEPPRVRARKNASVHESMRSARSRASDQGAVWKEVDLMLSVASVRSGTDAAADMKEETYRRDPERAEAIEDLALRGPLPGQCGIVVVRNGRVRAMDLFGAPHLLVAHWGALVRSHLLEPAAERGHTSVTRVLDMVRRFASAPAEESPGVGLGVEHRVARRGLAGHALTLQGALVHAAFFVEPGRGR